MAPPTLPTPNPPPDDREYVIKMYAAHLEDLGRIGVRHEGTRTFYLSVISALFVFLGLAGSTGIFAGAGAGVQRVIGAVGFVICIAWYFHMGAFADIYTLKKTALSNMEAGLPVQPFTTEGTHKRRRLTDVDRTTAIICAVLFVVLLLVKWYTAPVVAATPL